MSGFRSIVVYVPDNVEMLSVGQVAAVFGDRTHLGLPGFDVTFSAERPGQVRSDIGLPLTVEHGLDGLPGADAVLLLPGLTPRSEPSTAVLAAIRAANRRGGIVAAHGAACYTLAATGLLDGRRATTHWRLSADFAARHPQVAIEHDYPYVDEGRLITGAAAAEMYLYLIQREHGVSTADAIARHAALPTHHTGTQRVEAPDDEPLAPVLKWATANLHRPLPVDEMAAQALMSTRTFLRQFRRATGTTPHAWLLRRRMARAEELLANTELSVDEVARKVGYASGAVLRERFVKDRGLPPREYRRRFRSPARRHRQIIGDPAHRPGSTDRDDVAVAGS